MVFPVIFIFEQSLDLVDFQCAKLVLGTAAGFFSDQAALISTKIKTEYKRLFFYLAEANEQAHKYLAKLEVTSQDLKEPVAAALLGPTHVRAAACKSD
jgi:hypothetical protein